MHLLKLLVSGLSAAVLLSCGSGKTYEGDVVFRDSLVYVDDHPYNGEFWSEDSSTYCLKAEEGRVVSLTMYHDNGGVALVMTSPDTLLCYDESGTEIPRDSFLSRYSSLAEELTQLTHRMVGDEEETTEQ